jgi:nucleoside-diphosphate-sugar epimerase
MLGGYVVRELEATGYDVVGVDRRSPANRAPRDFRLGDLLQRERLPSLLGDCEVIVHLAARPSPSCGTPEQVYGENVQITTNVLELAERSARRVILASSECVVGYVHGPADTIESLPVNESHRVSPTDPYGLSKLESERQAATVCARSNLVVVALRPSWILPLDTTSRREWRSTQREPLEWHPRNFGGYVDARDAARAFRLAIEAPLNGFEACFIAAPETRHAVSTKDLLRPHFNGSLPRGAEMLSTHQSILDTSKAERLLGWKAMHSWRDLGAVSRLRRRLLRH